MLPKPPAGTTFPKATCEVFDLDCCPSGKSVYLQLPFGFLLTLDLAFDLRKSRVKKLANTDVVDYNEPLGDNGLQRWRS